MTALTRGLAVLVAVAVLAPVVAHFFAPLVLPLVLLCGVAFAVEHYLSRRW